MFEPVSPQGRDISNLFILTLALGGLVFALVTGLVIFAIIRANRHRRTAGEPRQVSGNTRLEIAWTIAPAVLLAVLFVPTVMVMFADEPGNPKNATPDIEIIGHQWWWEYRYPNAKVITANELHIPAGKKLLAKLMSSDVQHDFWVPRLGRKMDMYPDQINYLYVTADIPGLYNGNCAEYCGAQHAWMLIRVVAEPQADFDAWLAKQQKAPGVPSQPPAQPGQTAGNIANGEKIFLNNTCINCHAITGTTANAEVAPNLTYLGLRGSLGSGIIQNNSANLARWILNAKAIKPGVLMPAYQFSTQDLRDLVAYLEEQK